MSVTAEIRVAHGDELTPDSALELAVGRGDLQGAREALQRGADPEKIDASQGTGPIRAALRYARRRNKLYPSKVPSDTETDLDRALRNGLDIAIKQKARDLLRQEMLSPSGERRELKVVWRDAIRENRTDVQRAILLLAADEAPSFRVLQDRAVTDKEVAEVMKEIPYYSPKRGKPENYNGEVRVAARVDAAGFVGEEQVWCRHLVEHRHQVQERDKRLKFDDRQFASRKAIQQHVSCETDEAFHRALFRASEAHLFPNRDFGKILREQLEKMEAQEESGRLMFLLSNAHVMSVELRIKQKEGRRSYVARLYDPNRTTSHARVACDSLRPFEAMTLMDFIERFQYGKYYPDWDELSVMVVRPEARGDPALPEPARGASENRTLTSHVAEKDVGAVALFHLMSWGYAGNLRHLKDVLARRSEDDVVQALTARSGDRCGLSLALGHGHSDVVKAFFELLELVPANRRSEVLGGPGLCYALQEGHRDAAQAFLRGVFECVPSAMRAGLIGEALNTALRDGRTGAVKEYVELIKRVPEKMRAHVVAAGADGDPGLHLALKRGHAGAIQAFGEVLKRVPEERRAEVAAARNRDGKPGLYVALQEGQADAINAFGELLPLLPARERASLLADADLWLPEASRLARPDVREAFQKLKGEIAPRWSFSKLKLW